MQEYRWKYLKILVNCVQSVSKINTPQTILVYSNNRILVLLLQNHLMQFIVLAYHLTRCKKNLIKFNSYYRGFDKLLIKGNFLHKECLTKFRTIIFNHFIQHSLNIRKKTKTFIVTVSFQLWSGDHSQYSETRKEIQTMTTNKERDTVIICKW